MTRVKFENNLREKIKFVWGLDKFVKKLIDYTPITFDAIYTKNNIYPVELAKKVVDDNLKTNGINSVYFQLVYPLRFENWDYFHLDGLKTHGLDKFHIKLMLLDDTDIQNAIEAYIDAEAKEKGYNEE